MRRVLLPLLLLVLAIPAKAAERAATFCTQCGTRYTLKANFCFKDGSKLIWPKAAPGKRQLRKPQPRRLQRPRSVAKATVPAPGMPTPGERIVIRDFSADLAAEHPDGRKWDSGRSKDSGAWIAANVATMGIAGALAGKRGGPRPRTPFGPDAYFIARYAGERTQSHYDADTIHPAWRTILPAVYIPGKDLRLELWDDDNMFDDKVGAFELSEPGDLRFGEHEVPIGGGVKTIRYTVARPDPGECAALRELVTKALVQADYQDLWKPPPPKEGKAPVPPLMTVPGELNYRAFRKLRRAKLMKDWPVCPFGGRYSWDGQTASCTHLAVGN